jgi:hypothetical protein
VNRRSRPSPIARFRRLSSAERRQLLLALLLLGVVGPGLRLVRLRPLRRALWWAAERFPGSAAADPDYARRAAWAAEVAGRWLLPDGPCLAQALAVEFWLRRRGQAPRLRIGVERVGAMLRAHAWLEHRGEVLIGGPAAALAGYTPLPALEGAHS